MLGGQPPFTGVTVESIVSQHMTAEPAPVTQMRPTVPAEVVGTLNRMLAKTPADRFATGLQVVQTLSTPSAIATQPPATGTGPRSRKLAILSAAVAVLAIVSATGIIFRVASPVGLASADESKRILVLPLELVGGQDDAAFAEGLTAEIRRLFGSVSLLQVLGRETANQAKAAGMTTQEIGDELDVEYVLDGTIQVQRSADGTGRIRVIPELTRTAELSQVWSSAYEGSLDDVFAMQAAIAQRVVDEVGIALGEPERQQLAERPTESPEAYEQFVNGEAFFGQSFPVQIGLRDAVEHYARAVAVDPGFALAHAKLALAHGGLYRGGHDPSDARLAEMKAAADEALRLNSALPEARVAIGTYHYLCCRNYEQALDELSTALEQEPDNTLAGFFKAAVQRRMGNFEDAAVNLAKSADLDPLAWSPALEAGFTYQRLRTYEEALHYLSRFATLRPRYWLSYAWPALLHLARHGDVQSARELIVNADEVDPSLIIFGAASKHRMATIWLPAVARVLCAPDVGYCREAVTDTSLALDGLSDPAMHGYLARALLYGLLGDAQNEQIFYDSTAMVLQDLVRERPDEHDLYSRLGLADAALGRKNEAIRMGRRAVELCPLSVDAWACQRPIAFLAEIYARVGEYDAAVEQLDLILSLPSELSVALLRVDPLWDPLRDNPRFQALLEKYEN
jgi:serine/threonine-protein kinase